VLLKTEGEGRAVVEVKRKKSVIRMKLKSGIVCSNLNELCSSYNLAGRNDFAIGQSL
jgi:hypothetical protein